MAAPDARVVLRPRGVLESADLALRFVVINARTWGRMAPWVILPGYLASLVVRYVLDVDWGLTWLLSFVLAAICEGPFTVLSGQQVLQADVSIRSVLAAFAKRFVPFIGAIAVAWIFQGIMAAFLVIPWIFAAVATVLLPEVVLLEGVGLRRGLGRAGRLVRGFALRSVKVIAVLMAARLGGIALAESALRPTLGLLFGLHGDGEMWSDAGGSAYGLAGLWLGVPLCAAIRYFAYIDLRTLKEGWDLQRRFQRLSQRIAAKDADLGSGVTG